ncbi:hypothetical protein [Gynuella sunshinyii]|uniref:Uncharacterized protein n=1 Tax=Gynuella sunshinyii YC6258 TaxID=1445510 RepID=A0A0C5VFD8_9GAMM|nr:hypothetical protein [Gynuella sunshinyii]AJQ92118.1 hypothetical Protein YC6258_00062 [Gynuella sunshinyii YC6258]
MMTICVDSAAVSGTQIHTFSGTTTNSRTLMTALLLDKNDSLVVDNGYVFFTVNTNHHAFAVNSAGLLALVQRNATGGHAAFTALSDETGSSTLDSKKPINSLLVSLKNSYPAVTGTTDAIETHISTPSSLSDDHSQSPGLCTFKITGHKALLFNQLAGIQS